MSEKKWKVGHDEISGSCLVITGLLGLGMESQMLSAGSHTWSLPTFLMLILQSAMLLTQKRCLIWKPWSKSSKRGFLDAKMWKKLIPPYRGYLFPHDPPISLKLWLNPEIDFGKLPIFAWGSTFVPSFKTSKSCKNSPDCTRTWKLFYWSDWFKGICFHVASKQFKTPNRKSMRTWKQTS